MTYERLDEITGDTLEKLVAGTIDVKIASEIFNGVGKEIKGALAVHSHLELADKYGDRLPDIPLFKNMKLKAKRPATNK